MLVVDLTHYLQLPDDAAGPTARFAVWLSLLVRAGSSGPQDTRWTSAIACAKRPDRQPCPGYVVVHRGSEPAPITWRCDCCGDDGVVEHWEHSAFDLRLAEGDSEREPAAGIAVELTAAQGKLLHQVLVLDPAVERMVFRAGAATTGGIQLTVDAAGLEELVGYVAAEANAEANARRRKVFDELCDRLQSFASHR